MNCQYYQDLNAAAQALEDEGLSNVLSQDLSNKVQNLINEAFGMLDKYEEVCGEVGELQDKVKELEEQVQ